VVALLLVLILVKSLPWLQSAVQGHAHSHVADKPRYLYRSTFRDNPDTAYEQQLSQALRDIEAKQLTLHGPAAPSDTIWQIILGKDPGTEERGSDSLEFEEKNSDWKYKVGFVLSHLFQSCPCIVSANFNLLSSSRPNGQKNSSPSPFHLFPAYRPCTTPTPIMSSEPTCCDT
jgi:hypothetical protein